MQVIKDVLVTIEYRVLVIFGVVEAFGGANGTAKSAIAAERYIDIKLFKVQRLFDAPLRKIGGRGCLFFVRFNIDAINGTNVGASAARNAVVDIIK